MADFQKFSGHHKDIKWYMFHHFYINLQKMKSLYVVLPK
jgi:hypothetical protein